MVQPVIRRTLVDEVLDGVQEHVISNQLGPGDRLPTENELAKEMGVGRSTIREALHYLQAIGVLQRQPRVGSVLRPVNLNRLARVSKFFFVRDSNDLNDLFVVRRVLEVGMLPLVAANANPEHYEKMERACQRMESEVDAGGIGVSGDIEFHKVLMASTGNTLLNQLGDLVNEFLREARSRLVVSEEHARLSLAEHREMLRLLQAGDAKSAQRVLEKHLDRHIVRGSVSPPNVRLNEE